MPKSLMKGFRRPGRLVLEQSDATGTYAKFTAEPFERGYGTTIGNSLRRILLSSIEGYAISAVRISWISRENGEEKIHVISNEFENIPHVVEDTAEIIFNLKRLRVALDSGVEQKTVSFQVKGATTVTGATIAKHANVLVMTEDLHILQTMPEADLEIEIQIDLGRGYVPSEINKKYVEAIGTIPMDAIFSPVTQVKYEISSTRLGPRIDYDKLTIEIWTDGTILPEDALASAARIIRDHFSVFVSFEDENSVFDEESDEEDEMSQQLLETPVDELDLSVRSSNCLKNADIRNIGHLTMHTEEEITKTRNFGKKSLQEIKAKLAEWNLRLGMSDYDEIKSALLKSVKASDKKSKEKQNEA